MFESLNTKRTVMDGIDTEGMEFKRLKDVVNTTVQCKGFFFMPDKLGEGEQVVVVTDTFLLNMPKRAVAQFKQIRNTPEMLEAVLDGKLSIEVHDMVKTKRGATIAYDLIG